MTMIPLLADWHHHHGWFWLWPLVPLFWLTVFFLLARFAFRRGGRGPWTARHAADPAAILAERYARGEIDHAEYRERLGHLREP
jgi:putative membrane protein